jgi:uncharacterized protein (DUF58 family)
MNPKYRTYLQDGQQAGHRYALTSPSKTSAGLVGSHLGARPGSSLEFMDHRHYIPGDDLRRIDWNAFARSDKLSVKLYRDEVSPHVDIIVDCSASMALADTKKENATLSLAALIAQASANSDFTYTAFKASDTCQQIPNGSENPILWEGLDFESATDCGQSFTRHLPRFRPGGIRILISDLFWLSGPQTTLSALADKASNVFVLQLLAKSDIEPPAHGNIRLLDCETGDTKEIFIDATAQKRYKQNLATHQENWSRTCKQFGAVMTTLIAEDIVDSWRLDQLVLAEVLKVI